MKYFRLAGREHREKTDLRFYEEDINKAVKKVKPSATMTVGKTYYTTDPDLSKTESIKVSEILRSGLMLDLTTYRPCLFISTDSLTQEEQTEESKNAEEPRDEAMADNNRNTGEISPDQQKSNKKIRKRKS